MCIHYLGHLPLCPHLWAEPVSPSLLFDFVEEKNTKDNKKNMAFLLV
jgi:hypothetical protein